jgi:hypothetical protein
MGPWDRAYALATNHTRGACVCAVCRRLCAVPLPCAEAATAEELAHDELVREVVVAPDLKDLEAAYGQNDFADKVGCGVVDGAALCMLIGCVGLGSCSVARVYWRLLVAPVTSARMRAQHGPVTGRLLTAIPDPSLTSVQG